MTNVNYFAITGLNYRTCTILLVTLIFSSTYRTI